MVRAVNDGGEAQSIADIAVYEPTPDTMVEVVKTVVFEDIRKHETLVSFMSIFHLINNFTSISHFRISYKFRLQQLTKAVKPLFQRRSRYTRNPLYPHSLVFLIL